MCGIFWRHSSASLSQGEKNNRLNKQFVCTAPSSETTFILSFCEFEKEGSKLSATKPLLTIHLTKEIQLPSLNSCLRYKRQIKSVMKLVFVLTQPRTLESIFLVLP